MVAEVPQSGGAEERIGDGVQDDVAVAMGFRPHGVEHVDAGEHQPPPFGEAVNIESDADAYRLCHRR